MQALQMPLQGNVTVIDAVRSYSEQLFAFIRSKVPSKEDAEDILQDVWYQLSNTPEATMIQSVSGWLHRVAKNKITDRFRKKKETLYDDRTTIDEDGSRQYASILYDNSNDPAREDLKRKFWQQLFVALGELPEAQRSVYVMNELDELTFAEISARTGVNIKTLISRKRYAVQHLQSRLDGLYQEFTTE